MTEQQQSPQPAASATSADAGTGVEYVGFWARVGATLIDTIAAGLLLAIVGHVLGLGDVEFNGDLDALLANPQFARGQLIQHVILAIVIVACWVRFASTPGKRVIGAEVVDAKTFGHLRAGQAVLRYFAYYVSTLACCLGFIWVAIDARKQGWHDKIAGTVVIRRKP
jgi:uncharacterized RDD family membrane protein YckC